jgi:hypothetical protein
MIPAESDAGPLRVFRTSYLAISPDQVLPLMRDVGFNEVHRLDGRFFQPVLIGSRDR